MCNETILLNNAHTSHYDLYRDATASSILRLEPSGFLGSPGLVAPLFPDDKSAADELGVDGLLTAQGLVLITLREALLGELDVGGQSADNGLLGKLLGDINGLLL